MPERLGELRPGTTSAQHWNWLCTMHAHTTGTPKFAPDGGRSYVVSNAATIRYRFETEGVSAAAWQSAQKREGNADRPLLTVKSRLG